MTLRRLTPDDAAAVAAIYNHYVLHTTVSFETEALSDERMCSRLRQVLAEGPGFACEEKGRLTGYCYAHLWKERAAYGHTLEVTLYLDPEARGRGIGHRLLEALVAECRTTDCHALIACITAENHASRNFFAAAGFRQVSEFGQVGCKFGRWLDVVDYELLL